MVFPVIQEPIKQLKYISDNNSFEDYVFETCLGIQDESPADESDDIERVLQVIRIEEFRFLYFLKDPIEFQTTDKPEIPHHSRLTTSVVDVVVQPPQTFFA